jgi:hypothetical protein
MNLSAVEIRVLQRIIEKGMSDTAAAYDANRVRWEMKSDPVTAVLVAHQPVECARGWGCSCRNELQYVSANHVLTTHVRPIVEKAATEKVSGILARAGMDLDVIIKSDKIFGGE